MSEKAKELMKKIEDRDNEKQPDTSRTLTGEDLQAIDDIVYYKSRKTNNDLYGGLFPYISRSQDEREQIQRDLEDIKTLLKALINND